MSRKIIITITDDGKESRVSVHREGLNMWESVGLLAIAQKNIVDAQQTAKPHQIKVAAKCKPTGPALRRIGVCHDKRICD
jgi:hypothetical protein